LEVVPHLGIFNSMQSAQLAAGKAADRTRLKALVDGW